MASEVTFTGEVEPGLKKALRRVSHDLPLTLLHFTAKPDQQYQLRLVYDQVFGVAMDCRFWGGQAALVAPCCRYCGWTSFHAFTGQERQACGVCQGSGGLPLASGSYSAIEVNGMGESALSDVMRDWLEDAPLMNPLKTYLLHEHIVANVMSFYRLLHQQVIGEPKLEP